MALQSDNTLITNREMLTELVLAPFYALARGIEYYAENNATTKALRAVGQMSDEELAAKGLTRAEAVRMVLPHDM